MAIDSPVHTSIMAPQTREGRDQLPRQSELFAGVREASPRAQLAAEIVTAEALDSHDLTTLAVHNQLRRFFRLSAHARVDRDIHHAVLSLGDGDSHGIPSGILLARN